MADTVIVNPDGEIVAETTTEEDELLVHDCDLDATRFGKETMFDFARHRRIEHYGPIATQTGVVPPKGRRELCASAQRPRTAYRCAHRGLTKTILRRSFASVITFSASP